MARMISKQTRKATVAYVEYKHSRTVGRGVARGKCMWKQGVDPDKIGCDPNLSSWGFGGRCKPPNGVRGRAPESSAFLATIY